MAKPKRSEVTTNSHTKSMPMSARARRTKISRTPESAATLSSLAAEIRAGLNQVRSSCESAVLAAIAVGGKLIEAKQKCEHGHWEAWLVKNCKLSNSTAARYMRLARQFPPGTNLSRVTDLPIRQLLQLIAKPRGAAGSDDAEPGPVDGSDGGSGPASGGADKGGSPPGSAADDSDGTIPGAGVEEPDTDDPTEGETWWTDDDDDTNGATWDLGEDGEGDPPGDGQGDAEDGQEEEEEEDETEDQDDDARRARELAVHQERCGQVARLRERGQLTAPERGLMESCAPIIDELFEVTFQVVCRHAHNLRDLAAKAGFDAVVVQMVLVDELRAALDPAIAFSPDGEEAE